MSTESLLREDRPDLATLAEGIRQQTRSEKAMQVITVPRNNSEASLMLVPEGFTLQPLDTFLPTMPARKVEKVSLTSVASFIAYLQEHKTENTRIFAELSKDPYTFRAVIDYHGAAGKAADWCQHLCVLTLAHSDQFNIWRNSSNKFMEQAAFAEFLKDNRMDIAFPDSSSLATLVMRLDVNVERTVRGKVAQNDGVLISFEERVNATDGGGGVVKVPDRLELAVPMFRGGEETKIEADFKLRISDRGAISFGVRLLALDSAVRQAVQSLSGYITTSTGIPVYT